VKILLILLSFFSLKVVKSETYGLLYHKNLNKNHYCTAFLINSNTILSLKHCSLLEGRVITKDLEFSVFAENLEETQEEFQKSWNVKVLKRIDILGSSEDCHKLSIKGSCDLSLYKIDQELYTNYAELTAGNIHKENPRFDFMGIVKRANSTEPELLDREPLDSIQFSSGDQGQYIEYDKTFDSAGSGGGLFNTSAKLIGLHKETIIKNGELTNKGRAILFTPKIFKAIKSLLQ